MSTSSSPRGISPEEMGRLDRIASTRYGIPSLLLMENAGAAAFRHLASFAGSPAGRTVHIVGGKGNNGGDGWVVARHAHNAGFDVRSYILGKRSSIDDSSDPGINLSILEKMGIAPVEILEEDAASQTISAFRLDDIIVDGLLGTGLRGAVRGLALAAIEAMNASDARVLALDIPSGLDASTGEILGSAVQADLTVTFALSKTGHHRGAGPALCGELFVEPISIPREELEASLSAQSDSPEPPGE